MTEESGSVYSPEPIGPAPLSHSVSILPMGLIGLSFPICLVRDIDWILPRGSPAWVGGRELSLAHPAELEAQPWLLLSTAVAPFRE